MLKRAEMEALINRGEGVMVGTRIVTTLAGLPPLDADVDRENPADIHGRVSELDEELAALTVRRNALLGGNPHVGEGGISPLGVLDPANRPSEEVNNPELGRERDEQRLAALEDEKERDTKASDAVKRAFGEPTSEEEAALNFSDAETAATALGTPAGTTAGTGESGTDGTDGLDDLTVAQLREVGSAEGVESPSDARKADLIAAIRERR